MAIFSSMAIFAAIFFRPLRRGGLISAIVLSALISPRLALAQYSFEEAPINYGRVQTTDRVAKLAQKLASGEVELEHDDQHDYLPALLRELDIPVSSQALVFSKTSLQLHRISPEAPRAIYFNDDVYVGWVQDGYMIEIASMDDQLGGVFYTVRLGGDSATLSRDRGGCISCHSSMRTQRVPGFFIRSVFPREDGRPRETGTVTDHRSPFEGRWGGWYVTGTHGQMRHLGNEIASDPDVPEKLDSERGANVTTIADRLDLSRYLSPHSDMVALMVMEHQMQMQNFITLANYETRKAIAADQKANEAGDASSEPLSEETRKRIEVAGNKLVEYLLFSNEAPLTAQVKGTSGFTEEFEARGPEDSQGRSLRTFDLGKRLFKYPCSYLIYSSSFDALPQPMLQFVRERVSRVLNGEDKSEAFSHLTPEDRKSIREILAETKPGFLVNLTPQ
jgi:hypothetical protein